MKDLMEVLVALENNCGTFESIQVYAQNLGIYDFMTLF